VRLSPVALLACALAACSSRVEVGPEPGDSGAEAGDHADSAQGSDSSPGPRDSGFDATAPFDAATDALPNPAASWCAALAVDGGADASPPVDGGSVSDMTNTGFLITLPPPASGPAVPVTITIMTSDDNLRGDSTADALFQYADGKTDDITLTGPGFGGYPNSSVETTEGYLTDSASIQKVTINLQSHDGFLESNDAWNIANVYVSVGGADGGSAMCVLNLPGAQGITDGVPLPLSPGGLCAPVGTLALTFTTGCDDLRDDSTATVTVQYQGGSTEVFDLPASAYVSAAIASMYPDTFPAFSVTTLEAETAQMDAIQSVTVAMQSHGDATESQDHWVISELRVMRTLGTAAPQCILDQPGTVITTNVTDVLQPGGC
jgi:hypothetical protein